MACQFFPRSRIFTAREEYFGNRSDNSSNSNGESGVDDRVSLHVHESHDVDAEKVEAVKNTCGCSKKNRGPCSGYFDQNEYEEASMSMAELEKDELGLLILGLSTNWIQGRA